MVVGGYVKCIAEANHFKDDIYNQFKLGKTYQIKDIDLTYVETIEGYKLNFKKTYYDIECIYIGFNKVYELW